MLGASVLLNVDIIGDGSTRIFTISVAELCALANHTDFSPISIASQDSIGSLGPFTILLNAKGTDVTITFQTAPPSPIAGSGNPSGSIPIRFVA